jgi:transposase InsO family protein
MTPAAPQHRRAYDHRLREHVHRTGARSLGHRLHVPRSTISSWKRRGQRSVITLEAFEQDRAQLLASIERFEARTRILAATVRLLLALLRASGFRLAGERLPEGDTKASILRAVASAEPALPMRLVLRIIGLPASRYHAWKRVAVVCGLDDRSPCPRTVPGQLTAAEVATIKDMVLAPEYRHMPLRTLSLYAQRVGKVFASATTWARLVRERGWRRPRLRVHPAQPTVGVRASRPNEIWHIDVSVLNLLDGTKAYIHAIIDNFSRKILAWTVGARLDPAATCQVLVEAGQHLAPSNASSTITVMADSGIENVNAAVDATLLAEHLHRVLAQVEVTESNSMIEAWWRSLKHQWLFLNSLDTIARLSTLVTFFVDEHNTKMPHAAFRGHTPDEVYFGTAPNLQIELDDARRKARDSRLAANRSASCGRCTTVPVGIPP